MDAIRRNANPDEGCRAHVEFQKGYDRDERLLAGFPSGIIVGTVADFEKQHDDNFSFTGRVGHGFF